MKKFLLFSSFLISACASNSGVLQLGPDTYTVTGSGVGSGSISGNDINAKRNALKEANAYCTKIGRNILVTNTGMQSTVYGSTSDITFKCLDSEDSEYKRPSYRKEADITIENK